MLSQNPYSFDVKLYVENWSEAKLDKSMQSEEKYTFVFVFYLYLYLYLPETCIGVALSWI